MGLAAARRGGSCDFAQDDGRGEVGASGDVSRAVARSGCYDNAFMASLIPSLTPTSFGNPLIAMAASFSL